jgi:hypothetical protein
MIVMQCRRRLLLLYTRFEEHARAITIRYKLHPPARLERAAQQARRCHSQHRSKGSRCHYREPANIHRHKREAELCDKGLVRTKVRKESWTKLVYRKQGLILV